MTWIIRTKTRKMTKIIRKKTSQKDDKSERRLVRKKTDQKEDKLERIDIMS